MQSSGKERGKGTIAAGDYNTIIVGDFNTPFTSMDRSSKQNINKETQVLNDTLDEVDIIDIFRAFHPIQRNTPSSQVHMEHSPK